jgi:outer membrane protein OmpA-like peptidoglycan-associated protein
MRCTFNPNYYLVLVLLFIGTQARLQTDTSKDSVKTKGPIFPALEASILVGGANAYGDLVDARFFKPSNTNLAFGFSLQYQVDRNLGFRGSVMRGTISGSDLDSDRLASRGLSFEAPITELALTGVFDFLGHKRFDDNGRFKRVVSPYIFAGVAYGFSTADVDFSSINDQPNFQERAQLDIRNQKTAHLSTPIGLGVKVDLNRQIVLGLELGLRPVFNDYLDGVSAVGNPERNDWYSMGGLSIGYRFGSKDSDKDGFADNRDPCPNLAGPKGSLGCPDSDEDGLTDDIDGCPNEAGPIEANGCPDQDQDGVADKDDECPTLRGSVQAKGCPDRDADGVVDAKDRCPNIFGDPALQGCRDTDKDGIADIDDKCPYEKGPSSTEGCPEESNIPLTELDSDQDGIVDAEDECPYIAGATELMGCPDTDKDGIADPKDQCPYEAGSAENNGCPEIDKTIDTDGDGIFDHEDRCPTTPGTVEFEGCPKPDRDGDGVLDSVDPCPDVAGEFNGCPDTDSDGIPDDKDDCPELAGPASKNGCPELSQADKAVLASAVDNVEFFTGSYKLISTSTPDLKKIARLMERYPTYHLKIEGHTDNRGDAEANKQLSELRAKTCFEYLHEQGIAKERMSFEGFGEEQPRATNETQSGRRRNRRVVFKLYDPNE